MRTKGVLLCDLYPWARPDFPESQRRHTVLLHQRQPRTASGHLTNQNGTLTDTVTYDASGNIISQTGSTVNEFPWFAGQQFDTAAGQYYDRGAVLRSDTRAVHFTGFVRWSNKARSSYWRTTIHMLTATPSINRTIRRDTVMRILSHSTSPSERRPGSSFGEA